MSSTRDFKSPGIFAEDATTVIPPTPIAGVAYRDAVTGADETVNGWRYGTRVESQDWNQVMFLLTSMIGMMDRQGVLGWSSDVDYAVPAFVFGSNGLPYIALQASGPTTAAQDPISTPTYWEQFASHGIIELTSTQSWAVPMAMQLGYIRPFVTAYGGGGGGAHSESTTLGGGGGGGGGVGRGVINLTGIPSVSVTVGAGGAGKASGSTGAGSAGGNSSFGAFITCTGGGGGSTPTAGDSGTCTGAPAIPSSAATCSAATPTGAVSGSGGGGGGEGAETTTRPLGRNGKTPGGGGAGGGGTSGTRGGGNGAAGAFRIEW